MAIWTCEGPVRGRCGKRHRTADAAQGHCDQDARDCGGLGGGAYSDRRPVMIEPDYGRIVRGQDGMGRRALLLRRGKHGRGAVIGYYTYDHDAHNIAQGIGALERRAKVLGIVLGDS